MNRILVAVALLLPVGYLVFWAPHWVFRAAAAVAGALCFREFAAITRRAHGETEEAAGYAAGVALIWLPLFDLVAAAASVAVAATLALLRREPGAVLPSAAGFALGLLYCFVPWRCAVELHQMSPALVLFVMALNWIGDAAAFAAGRALGRHKMAPVISPGKSWEGAAASLIASVAAGAAASAWLLPDRDPWHMAGLSVLVNCAGQLGDLFESALKRGVGVKDSGTMLGSHGGWLDRVDANLFALPAAYLYWRSLG
ncbi:MAG: hypothetical protein FJW39_13980 [Acidobacteria bacterium]|nr:hypothetical protein [Acidobacteriota bacterium]